MSNLIFTLLLSTSPLCIALYEVLFPKLNLKNLKDKAFLKIISLIAIIPYWIIDEGMYRATILSLCLCFLCVIIHLILSKKANIKFSIYDYLLIAYLFLFNIGFLIGEFLEIFKMGSAVFVYLFVLSIVLHPLILLIWLYFSWSLLYFYIYKPICKKLK